MKNFLLLSIFLTSTCANAALITYSYDSGLHNQYESHDAVGLFTVDDHREGLVSLQFASSPATVSWNGYVPLQYDEVVATESRIHENRFEYFTAGNVFFDIWFDWYWLNEGENVFHHLDEIYLREGAHLSVSGNDYYLMGHFTKVRTVEVPEPSTLVLLSLGLLSIAANGRFFGPLRPRHTMRRRIAK